MEITVVGILFFIIWGIYTVERKLSDFAEKTDTALSDIKRELENRTR